MPVAPLGGWMVTTMSTSTNTIDMSMANSIMPKRGAIRTTSTMLKL